jgi:uncharacterized membrane protein
VKLSNKLCILSLVCMEAAAAFMTFYREPPNAFITVNLILVMMVALVSAGVGLAMKIAELES